MRNLQPLEHKISQYADDTEVAVTDIQSITELFKTLQNYEKATNSKINKEKTEGLWVGNWKNKQERPLNLKWTNKSVISLGIIIGNKVGSNGSKILSELNYAGQIETIKNKINYWKGKGLPLFSRVKIANIFILSTLWHRTHIWDISREHLETINRMIRNFIWEDKAGARVRQEVLQLGFEKGGLQLTDIITKIKTQRTKRILYLMDLDIYNFERFLADELVGDSQTQKQYGLSYGLFNNPIRIRLIKNDFYKNALEIIKSLEIRIKPGNYRSIENEPLFYNTLIINPRTNSPFELRRFKNQMPTKIKAIQSFPRSNIPEVNETIRNLRQSINNIDFESKEVNEFWVKIDNAEQNISTGDFKSLYQIFLNKKNVNKEWENRWLNYLTVDEIEWERIWKRMHNNINNNYTKSACWEMLHLNFWSNFRANENCHLCRELENGITHIVNECNILIDLIRCFKLNDIFDNKDKITFGSDNNKLANYILFHIKAVVFRARFKVFDSPEICKLQLRAKIIKSIKRDLIPKFEKAKRENKITEFRKVFLLSNQAGIVNDIYFWQISSNNFLEFLV